jgi:putative sterol carrier protein
MVGPLAVTFMTTRRGRCVARPPERMIHGGAVADPVADFFSQLSVPEDQPLLAKAQGTIRFDLAENGRTEHWLVGLDHGRVSVSRGDDPADCIVRADKEIFLELASGKENAMAAVLRGAVTPEGDPELLVLFQRILPAPPERN